MAQSMFDKFRIRQMAMRKGLGLTLKDLAARANTSYKTAVSWESEESPKRKDPEILLSICDVFQEELGKKFPDHQFNKTEVKKYLEEGTGDLGPAGQLLFEQPTPYGNKQEETKIKNPQVMESLEMHILGNISQDIMKSGTEAQKDRLKKAGRAFLRTALDIAEEMDSSDDKNH